MGTTMTQATGVPIDELARLHRLMTAYLGSKALFTALELGVFDKLEQGPATLEEMQQRLGLARRPTHSLLLALLGENLIERSDGRYRNTGAGRAFLLSDSPHYVGPFAAHQDGHFTKFAKLIDVLRSDAPLVPGDGYKPAFGGGDDWPRRLVQAANVSAMLQAEPLASKVSLAGHQHLIDLGCGGGAYSMALARRNPGLRVTGIDQPPIVAVTTGLMAEAGLTDRVTVRSADIFNDTFDGDVALVSHVLDGFGEPKVRELIEHVYGWLPRGGELIIHTHLPERGEVPFPYMMGLILVVNNTMGGELREGETYVRLMRDAGFRDATASTVSRISSVVRAVK
jgi:hypothetical protein